MHATCLVNMKGQVRALNRPPTTENEPLSIEIPVIPPPLVVLRPAVDPVIRDLCFRAQALTTGVSDLGPICQNIGAWANDADTFHMAEELMKQINDAIRSA